MTVDLYWLPLGAGDPHPVVRWSGRVYEAVLARLEHRPVCRLYHSALQVRSHGERFVIEMAPVWLNQVPDRAITGQGAVGLAWLGRYRLFRYEVRCWRNGVIPDLALAVASPQRLSLSEFAAQRILDLVPNFPTVTWGRDDLHTGEMWNSNSLISWLLARSGHDLAAVHLPPRGRAPGWQAGLTVAARVSAIPRWSRRSGCSTPSALGR